MVGSKDARTGVINLRGTHPAFASAVSTVFLRGGCSMKSIVLAASMLALAAAAEARQAIDHSHMHDRPRSRRPRRRSAGAPQPPAPDSRRRRRAAVADAAARRLTCPGTTRIPPGTADHATRALKESSRHGEWVDIKMADGGVLKSWVVYPERAHKAGVVLVIHDIHGMSRHGARDGRPARAGRLHRDRAGLPVGQGTERRRHRLARHRRRQDDPGRSRPPTSSAR